MGKVCGDCPNFDWNEPRFKHTSGVSCSRNEYWCDEYRTYKDKNQSICKYSPLYYVSTRALEILDLDDEELRETAFTVINFGRETEFLDETTNNYDIVGVNIKNAMEKNNDGKEKAFVVVGALYKAKDHIEKGEMLLAFDTYFSMINALDEHYLEYEINESGYINNPEKVKVKMN